MYIAHPELLLKLLIPVKCSDVCLVAEMTPELGLYAKLSIKLLVPVKFSELTDAQITPAHQQEMKPLTPLFLCMERNASNEC